MSNPIRWGILATGKIAHKFATGLAELPDAHLQAVASRDQARAEAFAREFGIVQAHGSYEALAADPEIDIVYVASPHALHRDHTLLCLAHGKHVLCEKPIALNAAQAQEMFEAAQQHGRLLMEAMWTRFLPAWQQARQWLDQGLLGDLRLLQADFSFLAHTFDPQHRNFNPALGGGALLDIGIYPIALAYWLFGEDPIEVQTTATLGQTGVDEQSAYLFRYANGAQAILNSSFQTHGPKEALLCGTKATLRVPLFWRASELIVERHLQEPTHHAFPFAATGLQHQASAVMEDLRAGRLENATMPPAESLRLMHMMDRLRASWGLRYPGE